MRCLEVDKVRYPQYVDPVPSAAVAIMYGVLPRNLHLARHM